MNQFGKRVKELRLNRGLLQKHIAMKLDIDTPMLSKIERGQRNAKKGYIEVFSKLFKVPQNELFSLWLADKVYNAVKDEKLAIEAIHFAEKEIKNLKKKVKNK